MKRWAFLTCEASAGMAMLSKNMTAPSFGMLYAIVNGFLFSSARDLACSTSPDQPSARQISPLASSSMYADEWILRTYGRTAISTFSAAARSSGFSEFASLPRKMSTVPTTSEGASSTDTPHLANLDTTFGSQNIAKLSTGASGMAALMASSL